MNRPAPHGYVFDSFQIDRTGRVLLRDGEVVPLTPKAFDILLLLVENKGQVVEKDRLMQEIWPDTFVEEGNLTNHVSMLRKALSERGNGKQYVQTIPKRGYRFVGNVKVNAQNQISGLAAALEVQHIDSDTEESSQRPRGTTSDENAGGALRTAMGDSGLERSRRDSASHIPWAVFGWSDRNVTKAGLLIVAVVGLLAAVAYFKRSPLPARPVYSSIDVSQAVQAGKIGISADGTRLAFRGRTPEGRDSLFVRSLDSASSQPLPGTEGGANPFWSPDGRFIAFFADGKLKRIAATGGHAETLCKLASPIHRWGSWGSQGVILFSDVRKVVYRVSESGGEPAQATQLDLGRQEQHWAPHFLPDGYHFLYSVVRQGEAEREIRVGALDSNLKKVVAHASSYAEYAQGYLLFRSTGSRLLMAQPFSIQRLDTTQDPLPITGQPEVFHQSSASPFSTSQNGVLVFLGDRSLVHLRWFDRTGHSVASVAEETWAYRLRLSPDGQRAAVEIFSSLSFNRDLWIYEVSRQVNSKFTFETTTVTHPVWSPDGSRIAFTIAKGNGRGFYVRASDGSGGNEVLLEPDEEKTTSDWSPNGQYISYNLLDRSKKEKMQIAILPLFGNRKPDVFLSSNSDQRDGQFSPDGHWIAFTSDETGKAQIYVARFPKPRGKQQVSVAGGSQPRWRRDGKELFFLDPDEQLMAAEVSLRNSDLEISEPRPLFKAHPIRVEIGMVYDVAPDGQRFLIPTRMDERTPPINLLLNWPAAVKRD